MQRTPEKYRPTMEVRCSIQYASLQLFTPPYNHAMLSSLDKHTMLSDLLQGRPRKAKPGETVPRQNHVHDHYQKQKAQLEPANTVISYAYNGFWESIKRHCQLRLL